MRAAVMRSRRLVVADLPLPEPGPGTTPLISGKVRHAKILVEPWRA